MEALYTIMALISVVITNIYCATVVADRYNIYNYKIRDIESCHYGEDSQLRTLLIVVSSVFAFVACSLAILILADPFSLGFDITANITVMLTWITGLTGFHSVKGFIRNFRKFLPGLSASTNKLIDKVIGFKDSLFNRAKTRVVAELHKDEEIKELSAKLLRLEELLKLSQANQPTLEIAPVESSELVKPLDAPATSTRRKKLTRGQPSKS